MVKRYDGNTGRVTHVEEHHGPLSRGQEVRLPPPDREHQGGHHEPPRHEPPMPPPRRSSLPAPLQQLLSGAGELETEDLLLMLILYLLYRESGDQDWLVTLGAMLFL